MSNPSYVQRYAEWKKSRRWCDPDTRSFGQRLLHELDPELGILSPEQHEKIVALDSGEAVSKMLHADLGDAICPDLGKAKDLFGIYMEMELSISPMIMTMRFYTIAQYMMLIDESREIIKKTKVREEKLEAMRRLRDATKEMGMIVNMIERLAVKMNCIEMRKPDTEGEQEPQKPITPTSNPVAPELA